MSRLTLHAKHLLVLGIALCASIPYGWRAVASVGLGGGIQIVNLRVLERGVAAMFSASAQNRPAGLTRVLFGLRWAAFLAVIALALLSLPLAPIAFAAGLSCVVPTVIWHGLSAAGRPSGGDA